MAAAIFTFVFASLLAPRAADAMASYIPSVITTNYAGSKLGNMCANCHSGWASGGPGSAWRIDYNLYTATGGAIPATNSPVYSNDVDNDGVSAGTEFANSQSATRPSAPWFPAYPDKDGDGCIQVWNRLGEMNELVDASGGNYIEANAYVGAGNGFITYGPVGWDMDDNDATVVGGRPTGCSAGWPTSATSTMNVAGTSLDTTYPGTITNFRPSNIVAAAIPLVWTATGDDGMTGTAHSYDIRYTTAALMTASLTCGAAGSSADGTLVCNVRDSMHWQGARNNVEPADANGNAGWNAGNASAPLMRALYEPVPVAPGVTQACNALGYAALCTANPGASYILATKGSGGTQAATNVIANGTVYWLANFVSDGVTRPTGTLSAPGTITEQISMSNIIAVTAGSAGTTATSGVAISSISPTLLTGTTSPATVTVTGFGLNLNANQVVNMYLTNTPGTVVAQATGLVSNGTTLTGVFTAPITAGTYNLELRNGTGLTNTKAAWVNAITVDPSFAGSAPAPTLLALSAANNTRGQGAQNQNIALTGTNFGSGADTFVANFSNPGITVNSSTRTSTTAGTANISVAAGAATGAGTVSVTVNAQTSNTVAFTVTAAPVISNTPPGGTVGVPYSFQMTATGGAGSNVWSATALPTGTPNLTISSGGLITGTPNAAGTFVGSVTVVDANAGTDTDATSIIISATVPTVTTPTATAITSTTATLGANVTSNGGATLTARGTCWGTTAAPTTNCLADGSTATGIFTQARTGLAPATTYFYRGYATNSAGTSYSPDGTFTTAAAVPTVTTPTATSIGIDTATLGANVTSDGGAAITARGTCWATTAAPTTNCVAEGGTALGVFTHARTGLPSGTLIYYRGYATSSAGTGYSADGTFTTLAVPTVTSPTATAIAGTSATLGANVTSIGSSALTARGTCWATTPAPTTNCLAQGGTTTGIFTHARTGLPPGTLIYYRGYATNAAGTGYSADGTFTTLVIAPTVDTPTVTGITATTATLGANVASNGGATLTARGTCWGTTAAPLTNCLAEGGTTTGVFTQARTGFASATTYFYRGYATNSAGTSYSADGTFVTTTGTPPTLTTPTATAITSSSATLGATVTNAGSAGSISSRGTCWGITAAPTTNCLAEGGTTITAFSHARTGLPSGTLIYYRGYAVSTAGTGYSPDGTFTTPAVAPTVNTPTSASITGTSATLGATIVSTGNSSTTVSVRGVCWSTTAGPTLLNGASCAAEGGTATGAFTRAVTPLTPNTTYFFSGYATNTSGLTGYSADGSITTNSVPTVTLPTAAAITGTTATLGANVTSNGGAALTARGTCWATTAAPTTNCLAEGGTAIGVFTQAVTGLPPGTLIYYRGYAINSVGTGYSVDGTFTTLAIVPTVTSPTATAIGSTTATLGANVTSNGGAALTARGTCWATTPAPTTNCVAEGGTTTGIFTHARTGLPPGTLIYYRGYATNSAGTGYSVDATFTTLAVVPTVTSPTATSIGGSTAILGANVTSDGGAALTARGTCWATTAAPTTNCVAEGGTTTGVFTQARTGLPLGTLIYYRGYATSSAGTGYSVDGTFTTLNVPGAPTIGIATATSSTSASVTFTPPASDGGAAIDYYTVTSAPLGFSAVGTGSPISVTGLTTNTCYTFTVTATNSVGESSASAASNPPVCVSNDSIPPNVTADPAGGSYTGTKSVTLTADEPATIYYTLDGSTPTVASTVYSSPISISSTTTLKFIGKDTAGNISAVSTEAYTISSVDLVMSTVSKSATSVPVLGSFAIDNAEQNQGTTNMTVASNVVKFYLSTDATITTADIVLTGTRTVSPALAAGAVSSTISTNVLVPRTVAPGVYYVGACADATSSQPEANETNNCLAAAGTITIVRVVDLLMTVVSTGATSVGVGASFVIDNTEQNQGTTMMTATTNTVKFYLSTDATITTADIALTGSRTVVALAAGTDSGLASTTVIVPKTTAPGVYYVGACADATNVQPETNETNNCLATGTITLVRVVDLLMTVVNTGATSVSVGTTFAIDNTEKNQGTTNMTATSNSVRFYLSTDSVITGTDIALTGSRTVVALAAGADSGIATTTVAVAKTVAPGVYYVGACADATNAQPETNETNNCLAAAGTITIVRDVDLVMSSVSKSAASVGVGLSFTVDSSEKNQGTTNMTVSSNSVRFYLSTDNVITSTDVALTGTRSVIALAAGADSGIATTTVYVPRTAQPGTYYVGACADATNVQPEINETNNCLATGTITLVRDVDLVMSAVSTGLTTSVAAGATLTVDNTETNQGTTPMTVSSNTVKFYLSIDATITSSDIALTGTQTVTLLAAGTGSAASTTVTVPLSVPSGTYYIGAIADVTNVQPESNEANNALAGMTIVVTP